MKINNVSFEYDEEIFKNINLDLDTKVYGVQGENGSGKTTFLNILNSYLKPKSGEVIDSEILSSKSKNKKMFDWKREHSYVLQFSNYQFFSKTVREDLFFLEYESDITEYIKLFNLPIDILDRNPRELSGGEQKKIALIGSIIANPKMLLLDEPTVGLDIASVKSLKKFIFKNKEKTIIITSHNVEFINDVCDDILFFENKTITKIEKKEFYKNELKNNRTKYLPKRELNV